MAIPRAIAEPHQRSRPRLAAPKAWNAAFLVVCPRAGRLCSGNSNKLPDPGRKAPGQWRSGRLDRTSYFVPELTHLRRKFALTLGGGAKCRFMLEALISKFVFALQKTVVQRALLISAITRHFSKPLVRLIPEVIQLRREFALPLSNGAKRGFMLESMISEFLFALQKAVMQHALLISVITRHFSKSPVRLIPEMTQLGREFALALGGGAKGGFMLETIFSEFLLALQKAVLQRALALGMRLNDGCEIGAELF
jgi:hypothetical protein